MEIFLITGSGVMIKPTNRYILVVFIAVLLAFVIGCNQHDNPVVPDNENSAVSDHPAWQSDSNINWEIPSRPFRDRANLPKYVDSEVLVVLDNAPSVSAYSLLKKYPLTLIEKIACRWGDVYRLEITDDTSVPDMVAEISAEPSVKFAEPNYLLYLSEVPYFPDDERYAYQGDPLNPRDSAFDHWGPASCGADIVWNDTKGSSDVVVAIIDTGIRKTHEDLAANIWNNEDEVPSNGIDDDLNGYVDDTWGWNIRDDNNNPLDDNEYYHGTACAGIVAGVQDNGVGISGVAPGVRLMAVKIDFGSSSALESEVVEGINYAALNNADIINMSFSVSIYSAIIEQACDDAWNNGNGSILVAAAGNDNVGIVDYPARFDSVIAVGATCPWTAGLDPRDEKRIVPGEDYYGWGSNYGEDLMVMGFGDQYTTTHGGGNNYYYHGYYPVGFFRGTSCATPFVAGVLALVKSLHPEKSPLWCSQRVVSTADDLNVPGFDIETGYGRVNAIRAAYGPDRFSDLEDPLGFVQIDVPCDGVWDSIHDVPVSPHYDPYDLYKFTTGSDGYVDIDLSIITYGENLDLQVFSDSSLITPIASSNTYNHFDSSFESIDLPDLDAGEYYIRVNSPYPGNSSSYGLTVRHFNNELVVTGENLAADVTYCTPNDVLFLKLNVESGHLLTIDEINIYSYGTLPLANIQNVRLYWDKYGSGTLDKTDILVSETVNPSLNKFRLQDLDMQCADTNPLTFFVTAKVIDPPVGSTLRLSLESYKDVATSEGVEAHYSCFPIVSSETQFDLDLDPPYWPITTGIQSATPGPGYALIEFNAAVDDETPPVKYNVYYTQTLPFDFDTANKIPDIDVETGITSDYEFKVYTFPPLEEWYYAVRGEDQAGNEDVNEVYIACTPDLGGDPSNPTIVNSYEGGGYDGCVSGNYVYSVDTLFGLSIYEKPSPLELNKIGEWDNYSSPYEVEVKDHYAYIGDSHSFLIIDVADPYDPFLVKAFPEFNTVSIAIVGDYLYGIGADYDEDTDWLRVYDISDPENVSDPFSILLPEHAQLKQLKQNNGFLYAAHKNAGMHVYSILNDPAVPTYLTTWDISDVNCMAFQDNIMYMGAYDGNGPPFQELGVEVYDVASDPVYPPYLGHWCEENLFDPTDIVINGDYAYVSAFIVGASSEKYLYVVDISDPDSMVFKAKLLVPGLNGLFNDGPVIYGCANQVIYVIL